MEIKNNRENLDETMAEWEWAGEILAECGWEQGDGRVRSGGLRHVVSCLSLDTQILVWHTRTEKPVLVNEGKKGFTDPTVEI